MHLNVKDISSVKLSVIIAIERVLTIIDEILEYFIFHQGR